MARKERLRIRREESLVAIIGDEDTVTGFLLSGIGQVDAKKNKNFFIVNSKTTQQNLEDAFKGFMKREDIAIVLITQSAAEIIRYLLDDNDKILPTVLEIPGKGETYDPAKDTVMARVKKMFGSDS